MAQITIVGLGGIGYRIAIELALANHQLHLVDHDTYEPRNAFRQPLATHFEPGTPKVQALQHAIQLLVPDAPPPSIHPTKWPLAFPPDCDIIVAAVDSNRARNAVRKWALQSKTPMLTVANERHDGEACWLLPQWVDTPLDPWVTWPGMASDTDEPQAVHCTSPLAAALEPQLPTTNALMASLATWMIASMLDRQLDPKPHHTIRAYYGAGNIISTKTQAQIAAS